MRSTPDASHPGTLIGYSMKCMQKFCRYTIFWCPYMITHNTLFSKYTDFSCPQNQRCARPYCICKTSVLVGISVNIEQIFTLYRAYYIMFGLSISIRLLVNLSLFLYFKDSKTHSSQSKISESNNQMLFWLWS